jgi:hypothetical protein
MVAPLQSSNVQHGNHDAYFQTLTLLTSAISALGLWPGRANADVRGGGAAHPGLYLYRSLTALSADDAHRGWGRGSVPGAT